MTLFLSLLPLYLLGNLHCIGMCGPLVMMIGHHRYRWFYFLGRTLSFSLAGLVAGGLGAVLQGILSVYHLSALASFLFGGFIFYIGITSFTGGTIPGQSSFHKFMRPFNQALSLLILRDKPLTSFLFGFFTVALPCGQTLVVFSACALAGSAWIGFWNGCAFALLTSPSLWVSMHSHTLFSKAKGMYKELIGGAALIIGILGFCRGFAELGWIPHIGVHPFILF